MKNRAQFQYKEGFFYSYRVSHYKDKMDHFIFIMGIPIEVRWPLAIEMASRAPSQY